MVDPTTIADRYHRHRQESDAIRLLWKGDLDHLERWEAMDADAIDARRSTLRSFAADAERAISDTPTPTERILAETISFTARAAAAELRWRPQLTVPNPATGLHALLLTFLPRYRLVTSEHGLRYHTKLRGLPEMLDQAGTALEYGRGIGVLPLSRHLDSTASAIESHLGRPDDQDPLAGQEPPIELDDRLGVAWREETTRIVREEIRPALGRYADALRVVIGNGRPDDRPGLCHLDGGAAHYDDLVWSHTSLDTSARDIHEIGLEQVARLEDEYRELAGPLLDEGDVDAIYRRLREDPELRYRRGADIVDDAERALARAAGAAPGWFRRLPESPCVASEISQGALAFYSKPDPKADKPGRFFFNTADPEAWGTFQLEAVTYHESIPGHHLQLALLVEDDSLHPVHTDLPLTVHSEGWGLYSERLADEMGLYGSDMDRVGMLAADSMRACRLVVDTGMHALGWSRDRAIDYVLDHSPLSRTTAEGEIDRYIGMPGQALSYMTGRLEIDRLRAESERRCGDDFDIREFHDRILRHGLVPLRTLRRLVL